MKRRTDLSEPLPVFLTVLCLGLCLLLPRPVGQGLVLAAAHAAWPEGSAVLLRASFAEPAAQTAVSQSSEPQTRGRSATKTQHSVLTQTPPDILQWIEEAKREAEHETKDGDIVAQTFGQKSSTDVYRQLLIRNATEDVEPDFDAAWDMPLPLRIDKEKPAVLIYHTHTTEGFETLDRDWYAADKSSRTEDTTRNIARVGSAIAEELERAGFVVLHDTTVHDRQYTGAYDRSRQTVQGYLDRYPELVVTLDVHRDAIQQNNGVHIKPVTEIGGKKAAQIMIIAGAEGGKATEFPNWMANLGFALHLQQACEQTAPTIMRPIFFCHRKYNMDMTPCSLLVEFGSDANTLEEAVYAGRLFGKALAELLENYAEGRQ